jgi:ABC-type antimicrobial peptide transport system permease subunit
LRVIGVVRDLRHYGLDAPPQPELYVLHPQSGIETARSMYVAIRSSGGRLPSLSELASAVHRIDPNLPLSDALTMEDRLGTSLARRRFTLALMVLFAGVAVLMAVVGIYGVMAYTVGQRVREMGVRMALGARGSDIVKLIVTRGAWLALAGVAAGTVLAVALSGLMAGLVFEVQATDASTYLATTVLLLGVAALAAYIPARRAGRIDPAYVLRHE